MHKIIEKGVYRTSEANPLEGTEVFLDPNTLEADGTASLGSFAWSENGQYLAYQVQRSGSDWATV